jgi:SAM-dependent methyltransferase
MLNYYPPRYLLRRYEILRNVRAGASFLEIGAGGLALSRDLLRYFDNGKALDSSPGSRQIYDSLPASTHERLKFEANELSPAFTEDLYDCVIACEVMEHVEDDQAFMASLHSHIRPNGQTILSVPAHMKFWTIHDEITGHYRRYERNELVDLFRKTGFENIRVIAYGYPFINALRRLRALYARRQARVKREWDKNRQTQKSGLDHVPSQFNWLGILVNPYTFLPLNWVARLFNNTDLSEGYIVIADKPGHQEHSPDTGKRNK